MKKFLVTLLGCGLFAGGTTLPRLAAADPELTAVGARDSSGVRTGDYKLVDAAGQTRAQGRFEKGKLEGEWSFFDSHQVKIAVITYREGVPSGLYRTYFSSKAGLEVAGKPLSEGSIQNGAVVGHFRAFTQDGKTAGKAFFDGGDASLGKASPDEAVIHPGSPESSGPQKDFEGAAKNDLRFIRTLDEIIRPAVL